MKIGNEIIQSKITANSLGAVLITKSKFPVSLRHNLRTGSSWLAEISPEDLKSELAPRTHQSGKLKPLRSATYSNKAIKDTVYISIRSCII